MFRHKCTQLFRNGKNVKQGVRSQKKGKDMTTPRVAPVMLPANRQVFLLATRKTSQQSKKDRRENQGYEDSAYLCSR